MRKIKSEFLEWVKTISISLGVAFIITLIVQPTIVSGKSMYPTLDNKDYILANKLAYKSKVPERGDIIVFKTEMIDEKTNNKKDLVKRVIALPGEHIIIKNNKVYINNKQLDESYINDIYTHGEVDIVVPKSHIFTMGDNRPDSLDSRDQEVGTISIDDIIGKVSIRVYPFNKFGKVNE